MLKFYLAKGEKTWGEVARRVSQLMPLAEQDEVEEAITQGLFYPGTPILRNAGSALNMSSCHSWIVGNSIDEIFEAASVAAKVFKSGGGGIGLDLSELQPSSTPLRYIKRGVGIGQYGRAAGPVGFWPLYMVTAVIIGKWRSGKPSGAMGTLNWSHADARLWASCKREDGRFNESNLTVTVDDWDALSRDDQVFLSENAWLNGTPGLAFLDNANANNPVLHEYGRMTTLNVCSEVIGWHGTPCVLSSTNLPKVIERLGAWGELRRVTKLQVRLLDRILDVNHYPDRVFQQQAQLVRQLGVGVMGWNDLLIREGIRYASLECNELADEVSAVIAEAALDASWKLAREKDGYLLDRPRNAIRQSIAPNGHIAPLAGVSPSICLNFNDPVQYSESLRLSPELHIRHLAVWARHTDSGISYTLPLRNDATVDEVVALFTLAHEMGIKTLSVYRDNSRAGQPCSITGAREACETREVCDPCL